ncbi:hypothetical protein TIFTF001_029494 [Ficus carica]|uniref:Retrotransposon gag domain-containing protein n=1 Tax=Ficus carica TaxID=3494 RepID=A0AA88DRY6_FICCA|nr:hypothetical protein TIFTF001_029494 [Ficus carica]
MDDQNKLDHLQRQLNLLVIQRYGLEQVGVVDPPFTPKIMAKPYPARFKMPTVASYDGSTDADKHLENYQAHMLIQNANEAALCKAFCLTLTEAARQWYRKQIPGSVDSFKQLVDALATAFLGAKTLKVETSYQFRIKHGESEPLKEYLDRFDKAVMQIKSCFDDTLIQAFWDGVKDKRLVWTIAYDVPSTFAHLRGIARKHAEADEYIRGRGLVCGEQSRLPERKLNKDVVEPNRPEKGKAAPDVGRAEPTSGPKILVERFRQYTPLVTTAEHILNQISGRGILRDPPPLLTDRTRRNQNKYCNFHKDVSHVMKDCIQLRDQIELLVRDGHLREFVEQVINPTGAANRPTPVQPCSNPGLSNWAIVTESEHVVHTIFGGIATGDTASSRRSYVLEDRQCIRAIDTVCLPVTVGDGSERATRMVEFLVVDRPLVNNIILGKPTLNALKAVVSTYHLAMKFPTSNGDEVFRGNQERARKCYMEDVSKLCRKAPQPAIVTTVFMVDEMLDTPGGEIKALSDLDPRMLEEEVRAHPVEDIVQYQLDPSLNKWSAIDGIRFEDLIHDKIVKVVYFFGGMVCLDHRIGS